MKTPLAIAFLALAAGGCATMDPVAGMDGKAYTSFTCEGRGFSGRMEEGNAAARLRTHEGSVTVERADDGTFKGDGWTFYPTGANGIALAHKDKVVSKNCKKG